MSRTPVWVDPKAENKPSERFVITINLGADTETFNKSIAIDANDIARPAITKGEKMAKRPKKSLKEGCRPKNAAPVG